MSAPTLSRIGSARRRPSQALPLPRPEARRPIRGALVGVGLAAVLTVFGARCARVATTDSITSDESTHLVHTLHYWMTGDDLAMWDLGAPRLPHVVNAWPSYLILKRAGMLPGPDVNAFEALTHLVLSGSARVLVPARFVAIGSGLALLVLVFWAVARRRGATAGLVAAGIVSMVPEVLAHSTISGSDMPFTAAAFLALVLTARYVERPGARRWLALSLAVGLAWAVRHTALLLIAIACGAHLICALRRPRAAGALPLLETVLGTAGAGAVLGGLAFLVLWAGDGFGTISLGELADHASGVNVPRQVGPVDLSRLPLPTSALSVVKQVRHQNQGHEAYFLGETGRMGWPTYFPVAFLLKTPVGLIALMVIAAARFRPRDAFEWVFLAFLTLLWITLVRNKVNIGLRYALLTYPLAAPWLARLFERDAFRDRVWAPIAAVALVAFAGASLACHPRYLSYFNEVGGGPHAGWLYLADSNVDWGQDFGALATTLKRLGIREVTTDISSERRLSEPGIFAVANPSKVFQVPAVTPPNRRLYDSDGGYAPVYTRYVAASVSRLLGLYSQNDLSWLRTRKVVARVGDSLFLFDLDTPADRPFGP